MDNQNVADSNTIDPTLDAVFQGSAPGYDVLEREDAVRELIEGVMEYYQGVAFESENMEPTIAARGWDLYASELVRAHLDSRSCNPMGIAAAVYDAADHVLRPRASHLGHDHDMPIWAFARYIHECRKPVKADLYPMEPAEHVLALAISASVAEHRLNPDPEHISRDLGSIVRDLVHSIQSHAPEGQGLDHVRRFCQALLNGLGDPQAKAAAE